VILFLENINLLIETHERNRQTDRQDYYGNTALCIIVHRGVKMQYWRKCGPCEVYLQLADWFRGQPICWPCDRGHRVDISLFISACHCYATRCLCAHSFFPLLLPVPSLPHSPLKPFLSIIFSLDLFFFSYPSEQELSSCWGAPPFGHNRRGPKSGGCCAPFRRGGELSLHLTQCGLSRGLPPYQVAS